MSSNKESKVSQIVKLEIIKPLNVTWDVLGEVLRDTQYNTWKMANKAIQMQWDYQNFDYAYKTKYGSYFKNEHGTLPSGNKTISADIMNETIEYNKNMNSNMKDAILRMVTNKWKNDIKKVLSGEQSVPSFNRSLPIELHNKQMMNTKREVQINREYVEDYTNYTIDIAVLAKKYAQEKYKMPDGWFKLLFKIKNRYQSAILDRLMEGEYSLSMSKMKYDERNKKWFLLLGYSFPEPPKVLNEDKIMGIDIGVNIPAMLAINEDKHYRRSVGDAKEVNDFTLQMNSRRRRLQKKLADSGTGRRGHGRKTFLKPLDKLGSKVANFKETKNHQWSRVIVEQAIKNNCGTIQMEDLTGISENNTFLKSWTFYSLQQKIKYKAELAGIKVVFIDPKYTSSRCNECGHIHRSVDKQKWRPSQEQFFCQSCGHQTNADYNAAKNISTKDIDKIISKDMKKQKKNDKVLV